MKTLFTLSLLLSLAVGSEAHAALLQTYDNSSSPATTGGVGGNLNIGRQFTVTGTGITIEDLGVYDDGGTGLATSHDVTLFSISGIGSSPSSTPLATVNIPANAAAPLIGGFRFEPITPIYLAPGNYSVVAYGTNTSGDPYGDGGGQIAGNNVTPGNFDPFQFTGNVSPAYPQGGDNGNHSSASFLFAVGQVPEPSTVAALAGLGVMGLIAAARRRRKASV